MYMYMRLVGVFDELSTRRHGTENFKMSDVRRLGASYVEVVSRCISFSACRMNVTRCSFPKLAAIRQLQAEESYRHAYLLINRD